MNEQSGMNKQLNGLVDQHVGGKALDELHKSKPASKFQKRLGFVKRYNYLLWMTLSIIMVLFSLIHMPFIEPDRFALYKAAPGELYWYRWPRYRYGMVMHLAGVLPSGLLAPLQFIPALRRPKWITLHRYIGYTIITLMAISGIPGAVIIANHSFGGTLDTQLAVFVLAAAVYTALALGAYNIWKLQLDQHRKWMLRAMIWMSEIIIQRVWLIGLAMFLPTDGYQTVWTCEEAAFTELNATRFNLDYPQCLTSSPDTKIIVNARMDFDSLLQSASALRVTFGTSVMMGFVIHVLATEIYLALTKDESERLRRISYTLQQKAGYANPGSAGLTADKFGDSSWSPPSKNISE